MGREHKNAHSKLTLMYSLRSRFKHGLGLLMSLILAALSDDANGLIGC